mgnify:CR=1 FL=1
MNITKLQWWLPKILCLIAACAFWAYVMNEQDPQVESAYIVPVEVKIFSSYKCTYRDPSSGSYV